jgi:hypothetical protein
VALSWCCPVLDSHSGGDPGLGRSPAGYFPFCIGLIIIVCSLVTLGQAAVIAAADNPPFVLRGQLKMVTLVMVPTLVYIALIR